MNKLSIPPDQAGYGVTPGSGTKRTELDGGLGRYRRDILNQSSLANCSWTVNREEYNYLMAFFRINEKNGGEGFYVDLILDTQEPTEYTAHIVPGSFQLTQQRGTGYTVTAQLEVEAVEHDYEYDQGIIDIYEAFGNSENAIASLNLLHKVVHYDLPNLYDTSEIQSSVYFDLHSVIHEDL